MRQKALLVALLLSPSWAFAQSAVVSTNPPAYTAGAKSLSQTPSGGQRVQPQDGAGHDCATAHPCPTTATITGTVSENLAQVNGQTVNVGTGAAGTGTQRVTTSTDSTIGIVAGSAIIGKVGIDQTTPGTTNAVVATQAATATSSGLLGQQCTVACASSIVSGVHNLYAFIGSSTVSGWFLIYDATTCSGDGTVTPARAIAYQAPGTTVSASWGGVPKPFATGIAICFSTTGPYTATASTTAFVGIDYK